MWFIFSFKILICFLLFVTSKFCICIFTRHSSTFCSSANFWGVITRCLFYKVWRIHIQNIIKCLGCFIKFNIFWNIFILLHSCFLSKVIIDRRPDSWMYAARKMFVKMSMNLFMRVPSFHCAFGCFLMGMSHSFMIPVCLLHRSKFIRSPPLTFIKFNFFFIHIQLKWF